jgi:hypothetical protein
VAAVYQFAARTLRDRLLEDAGRNDVSDLEQLEAAANIVFRYVEAMRGRAPPSG